MSIKSYHHGNLHNKLIEEGISLINERGMDEFSLRKVAAMCKVSHSAPYSHFKDKEALIQAMGDYVIELFMIQLLSSIESVKDKKDTALSLGKAYINFFKDNPQYYQFIFYNSGVVIDLDQDDNNSYPPFALFRRVVYEYFEQLKLPKEKYTITLLRHWSIVHGVVSLLTTKGIHYSGDFTEVLHNYLEGGNL